MGKVLPTGATFAVIVASVTAGLMLDWTMKTDAGTSHIAAQRTAAAVLGINPAGADHWVQKIAILAIVCAIVVACWLLRHPRDGRAALRGNGINGTNDFGVASDRLPHFYERPFQEVPRALLENPYGPAFESLDVSARVQMAIEASLRHGRVIAVMHFESRPTGFFLQNGLPATAEGIAEVLRANIRSSDGVHMDDDGNVFVFLSLISNKEKVDGIGKRLAKAIYGPHHPASNQPWIPGCAMYPIDGYNAEDLMLAAKARSPLLFHKGRAHRLLRLVERHQ